MEVRQLKHRTNGSTREQEFGQVEVGRGANKSEKTATDLAYESHMANLEGIRLTGYRFLKVPGVNKTLKNIHEEEAYNQEFASSMMSQPASPSLASRSSDSPDATTEQVDQSRHENQHLDEDNFDFTPDHSMPTMDASLPSTFHTQH